jgi:hypothetical protein
MATAASPVGPANSSWQLPGDTPGPALRCRQAFEDRGGPELALDDRLKRIYDAGASALSQQDTTLSNLRNRSTAVITTAGLVASFSAGLGLINFKAATGSVFPRWGAFTLVGLLAAIAVLTLYVLWPVTQFAFGPSSAIMYERYNANEAEEATVKFVVEAMNIAQSTNEGRIHHRMRAFEVASALLFVEFVVVVVASVVR